MKARGLEAAFNEPRDSYVVHISIRGGIKAATLNGPHTKHIHRAPAEECAWNLCRTWREVVAV